MTEIKKTELTTEALLAEVNPLLASLKPACLDNCTVDLINVLKGQQMVSEETFDAVVAQYPIYTDQDKIDLWHTMQNPLKLNTIGEKKVRAFIAILSCQWAVLLAHRLPCVQAYDIEGQ